MFSSSFHIGAFDIIITVNSPKLVTCFTSFTAIVITISIIPCYYTMKYVLCEILDTNGRLSSVEYDKMMLRGLDNVTLLTDFGRYNHHVTVW